MRRLSVSKKSAYGVLFRNLRCFPLVPAGLPGGKHRKETLLRKLPNPPHMSPDSDCIWKAAALQTTRKVF